MKSKSDKFKYADGEPRKLRPPSERFLKAVEATFGPRPKYTVGNPPKKEDS